MKYKDGWVILYHKGFNNENRALRESKETFESMLKELEEDKKVTLIVWYKVKFTHK